MQSGSMVFAPMSLGTFLHQLLHDGRVRVDDASTIDADQWAAAEAMLLQWERAWRLDLPGTPPPIVLPAARWAVERIFRGCQGAVYRAVGNEQLAAWFASPLPPSAAAADPAGVHYSVDLTFRFLPDLCRLARSVASEDPLVAHFQRWAAEWPLSSVGMPGVAAPAIGPWFAHPTLQRMYVDRILARRDRARLVDPRVAEAVRRAIGVHADLAGELAAVLFPPAAASHPLLEPA